MMQDAAYVDAVAAMIGLPIAEAHRPGVERFLAIAAEMAAVLDRVPLDDGLLDLAPVYRPPEARR
jgi:Protein of unknown function (DUF4089)